MSRTPTPWAAMATTTRRAVKAARAAGTLTLPEQATVKVTSDSFAGGASVDVWIGDVADFAWMPAPEHDQWHRDKVLTPAVLAAAEVIEQILFEARRSDGAGYIWGGVTYEGTVIGSLAREGWVPGSD